jgi:hypothetical protein
MFIDVEFGGVEASTSWGSYVMDRPRVVDRVFLGEILVGLLDTDAVTPLVAPFLPEGRHGYPSSSSLCVLGKP